MPKKRWAAAAWLLLAFLRPVMGQGAAEALVRTNSTYIIDLWDTEKGLPQNEVTSIVQDRDGYLWLGTPSGLVRFDGLRFTVLDESNTSGLDSSRIVSLFEDSQRNLWVGTEKAGVVRLRDGQVVPFGNGRKNLEGRLVSACEDPSGAVWLYMQSGELWRYQNATVSHFPMGADLASDYRGVMVEPDGPLWVGTDTRLYSVNWQAAPISAGFAVEQTNLVEGLDYMLASRREGYWRLNEGHIQKWTTNGSEVMPGWYPWINAAMVKGTVKAACEDREGNLIVGTWGGGAFWFSKGGQADCISTAVGLANNYVLSLCLDREGNLWVGTDGGGLNRVKRPLFDVEPETRGLVTQSAAPDDQGGLWVGYNEHSVVYRKDDLVQEIGGRFARYVRTVFVDRQHRVWGGTWGAGLLQFTNGQFEPVPEVAALNRISVIHQDKQGRLWIGAQQGLARWDQRTWTVYTSRDGLSGEGIQAIADDVDGDLWVGTAGGGLDRLHDGSWTVIRKSEGQLPSDNVSSLYIDREGALWIGTDGAGLARLRHGQWTHYTRQDGLVSNTIGYLLEDHWGYLWIGSNAGLMRVSTTALNDMADGRTNSLACRVYGKSDGLPTRECTMGAQPGVSATAEGELWFPTIKGLAAVNPATLQTNSHAPPVTIESVAIDGFLQKPKSLRGFTSPLRVPPHKEAVEIQFSSLSLSAPERARFKCWLEGHESTWTDVGNTRVARYTGLPPADYRFHVTACNEDGVWNETGATLAFTVLPPFYRTGWFLGTMSALTLGAIAGSVNYFSTKKLQRQLGALKQREALEKERARIARDIHDQVGASLTQVALLGELVESDKDAPAEVEAHARQISQTARETTHVLDEIVWAVNPSNDTLDGLVTYICKYTQEYLAVAGLHYRLDVPQQLPNTNIPPEVRHNVFLVCKEAVTNIVRHARATEAHVRLRLEPESFTVEIQDNGRGVAGMDEKAARNRNGLRNMRNRMESIGGEFAFGPAPGGGTLVRLKTPLQAAELTPG
jgi:ligand-binding sensor domain-containing protein/signal transduction histidine kinase